MLQTSTYCVRDQCMYKEPIIEKNEDEYLNNLFDIEQPQSKTPVKTGIDHHCLRKINILTSKDRPFCGFCECLCGFEWYNKSAKNVEDEVSLQDQQDQPSSKEFDLCNECFKKENYPSGLSQTDFTQRHLTQIQWDRISQDLSPEVEQVAK